MKIGTYYYPEHWPKDQWQRDFDNMAQMGLQIVHMGEFAWFKMEPEPGVIQLGWLSECVELAAERRMSVILCTPTAAPPIWLSTRYPGTLLVDEHGAPARVGARRHYTPTSPELHEATKRIVTALGDEFGNHPAVIGWQIDNEFSAPFDQGPYTHAAFRQWLKDRYHNLEQLNQAWGCAFWNTYYTDWDQILMPPSRSPSHGNPHQRLDASRFWSQAFADFNKLQADILRYRVGARFITHNFMPFHLDVNPGDLGDELSMMAWDAYMVHGMNASSRDEMHRIGNPSLFCFVSDQMASYHKRWGILELQPGTINWSGAPVQIYPGAIRLWLWTAFAHGAEFVTTYRYRQPRYGVELYHHGLVGTDGVSPSPGGREFVQVIEELQKLDLTRVPADVEEYETDGTIGLVFDFDQLWQFSVMPQAKRWSTTAWLLRWYGAATRLGLHVRILHPGEAWRQKLPLILAPSLQMVDDTLLDQLKEYAEGGGHLVLTCRSGWMDRNGHLWEGPTAAPLVEMIGASIEAYDGLPEGADLAVDLDDENYHWDVWGELLNPSDDTRVLSRYETQFYAGAAAVTQNKYGEGLVTYCGVCGEQSFIDKLLEKLAYQTDAPRPVQTLLPGKMPTPAKKKEREKERPGFAVHPTLPRRVHLCKRGPYRILLNYRDQSTSAPAPEGTKFIIGGPTVGPAGVAVWIEE